ncbi:hypothetical protein CI109_105851 [Kwoniella shandongensis]|uniref:Uncharacterized protein n=1 Tax=Kwoniella shandongensis TaxID=1734106 RepID=A0A5M6BT37_9TREE|nr:uncharacterized protein CI109_005714 [Kwoniella shandongensis]KAA5525967.1 hypothetical protein CI109_005714 [Kwoniella shandongensis]
MNGALSRSRPFHPQRTPSVSGSQDDFGIVDDDENDEMMLDDPLVDDPTPQDRYSIFQPAVQSLVNALGGYEEVEQTPGSGIYETIYRPGDSVLAVLKDLKKLWRKDDEDDERTVARCMYGAGLMRELVAILVECTERGEWGRKVALVACDLIAALTWPIDVAQELKEMEDEPDVVTDYASLLRAQVEYKALILQNSGPLRCLLALMLPSLAKPRKDEKDERIISLGLHVVRNLLAIKDIVAEGTAVGEKEEFAKLQSNLIVQLNKLTYFQLLLTLASCADKADFNPYNVLVLDILHLVFRSVKVRDLGRDQARAPIENLSKLLESERRHKALITRVGMTRHSRFGTTVAVRAGEQKIILHKQNAVTENPGKILDEVKRKRKHKVIKMDDLTHVIDLSPDAMRVLQTFAKSFIQSCFNTFFTSIFRDIRMERTKIRPSDNTRTFYLARFFIEYLLLLRNKEDVKGEKTHELSLGLVAEMAEIDTVRFLFSRMRFTMDDKPPAWTELQACLDCFTQILLLIDAMAVSEEDEDLETAEVLQHQLYYNGDILDSSLSVVMQYKDQSVAYLDSVIHFAYVLLRMLEKYSKTKAFMFVRKRKAARKKRKQAVEDPNGTAGGIPEEYGNEEEADLEPDKEAPSYAEHAFTFQAFEKRFAQEPVVNTLLAYLSRFQEFEEPEQMKRVVGLMHRQVVKTQAEGLFYKVSTLNLFRRILDEQHSLPKADSSKDLLQLVNFVLRKFFKRVAEDPFVIVEALSSKARGKWKDLSSYKSDDESDDGMGGQRGRIQEKMGLAELEFKKSKKLSWSQQMGVVVSILVKDGHEEWIKWIISIMEIALAARTEIVLAVDGEPNLLDEDSDEEGNERRARNFAGPSKEAMDKFAQHDLDLENDEERAQAVSSNPHLRLMLKLLSFDMVPPTENVPPEEPTTTTTTKWFLPSSIPPSSISTSLGALNQFLLSPPDDMTDDPKSLLRRARPPKARKARSRSPSFDYDSETGELKERQREKKKRTKKAVETQTFKSAAFIEDSDDEDEDTTKRFFEKEAELRKEMEALAGQVMGNAGQGKKRKRNKGKGKADLEMGLTQDQSQSQEPDDVLFSGSENESESGSEPENDLPPRRAKRPSLAPSGGVSDVGSDEDEVPSATARTLTKSRRIVDSDDEDE